MEKSFFIILLLTEVTALSFNLFVFASVKEINKYSAQQNLISSEVDTLYYLPDTAKFDDQYAISTEIYNIHTRFFPPDGWEYYKVKEVKFLFSSMVIGDTLKKIDFFKDTLNSLIYRENINGVLDSSDVYPNWYTVIIPNDFPAISGEIEVPAYLINVFTLCIPKSYYNSGNTLGFFEASQKWGKTGDYPIKLIIERSFTDVKEDKSQNFDYMLYQNFPNPFNPDTRIKYTLKSNGHAKIIVYDLAGKEVNVLIDEYKNAGPYEIKFTPKNLSSGIYYYKLFINNYMITKKMIYLK
ncbi:MAG: T9SS type A sorting domain-containing protein [Ignavibacteriaceae bacterium]